MTAAAGAVWTTDPQDSGHGLILRLDPVTNAVTARIPFADSSAVACGNLAGDDTTVWLASSCDNTYVARIDPQTNKIAATIDVGNPALDVALGSGSVWVTAAGAFGVTGLNRIDPATNKVTARTKLVAPTVVASGAGSIWVGSDKNLLRITPG